MTNFEELEQPTTVVNRKQISRVSHHTDNSILMASIRENSEANSRPFALSRDFEKKTEESKMCDSCFYVRDEILKNYFTSNHSLTYSAFDIDICSK